MIGEHLGVDLSFRESLIRDGVQRTNEEILEAVLNYWIETHCSEVSWYKLIQVLTELGFSNTALDVRRFLQIDTGIMKYNLLVYHICLNKSHSYRIDFFNLRRTTSSDFGGCNSWSKYMLTSELQQPFITCSTAIILFGPNLGFN